MKVDFHIHSKYSIDSNSDINAILKYAKKKNLDGIAITDHNTIKGAIKASKMNEYKDFLVIIGEEIHTDVGDITGLFLNEEIKSRNSMDVIEEIKKQGGIVVLPHPYKAHKLNDKLVNSVDLIEIFNSRTILELNEKAKKLAEEYSKPFIAGSDAHFASEIGMGKTIVNLTDFSDIGCIQKTLLSGKSDTLGILAPLYLQSISQIIKSINMKEYGNVPIQIFWIIIRTLRSLHH